MRDCPKILRWLLAAALWFLFAQAVTAQELGQPVQLTDSEIEALTVEPKAKEPESTQKAAADGPIAGFTVDTTNRNDVLELYHTVYLASENFKATHGWTGDVDACDEGTTSNDLIEDTRRRVNYFRAMAGLTSTITFDATKNAKAQEAALIMSRQNSLSHNPNVDFAGNPCLSADGQEAASSGNLSLGNYGPNAINGQLIDDGSNNAVAGHRRWILYSRAQEMGTGDIPGDDVPSALPNYNESNCLYVIGNFASAPSPAPEIAWPPAGFVPYHLAPNDAQAFPRWSFSYPEANFAAATITMTQGATPITVTKETVQNGFGDNTIVWRPSGIPGTAPASDTTYTVTISGITGAPFSSRTYDVTLIDPFDLNDEVVVTGPASPPAGAATAFNFNAITGASGYEACIGSYVVGAWTEGAEAAPVPDVIDNTDGSYGLFGAHSKATGSRGFHLATPEFRLFNNFVIDRQVIPESGSQVQFKYRRLFMHASTKLRVQISLDAGQSFTTIHTIDGNNTGSSAQWDSASFLTQNVAIPAEYHNHDVRIRFMIEDTGTTFLGSDDTNGIYIDDVSISNSLEVTASTKLALGAGATSFNYTPAVAGEMRVLMVSPELGGRFWGSGPALKVTSIPGGPSLSVADVSTPENSGPLTFTIVLSQIHGSDVTVNYLTSNGTAFLGSDYTAVGGLATITAGSFSETVDVPIVDDMLFEPDETFSFTLSNPSLGIGISDGIAVGTIANDDSEPTLTVGDAARVESATEITFTITLSAALLNNVTFTATTSDSMATAGADYTTVTENVTIFAGQTSATVNVPIVQDSIDEPHETFNLTISNPGGALIADSTGIGTIIDDDDNPATDDGDALSDLFEYFLGTNTSLFDDYNAHVITSVGPLPGGSAEDYLQIEINRSAPALGVTLDPEISNDLNVWHGIADGWLVLVAETPTQLRYQSTRSVVQEPELFVQFNLK
ncbi:MAG: hypothetical protein ACI8UO_002285 [Verrucomicrobiales bacterium]|jgi:hypothetical protein